MTRGPSIAVKTVVASLLPAAPATASSRCRVENLDTGVTRQALQRAVDDASAGNRLSVRGTCVGSTLINKDLRISGIETATSGPPTLDGAGQGRVVTVGSPDYTHGSVVLTDLTITGRRSRNGGGIRNRIRISSCATWS